MPENEAASFVDERQPFHVVDGKVLTQSEWRMKLRNAVEVFDEFKRQAYKNHEL